MLLFSVRRLLIAALALTLAACGKSPSGIAMPGWSKKYNCNSCHTIDSKLVGPAWMDVARKYQGDSGAAARLSEKITNGGGGVWGVMTMPPNSRISDAENKEMVNFILGLAKQP